MGGRRLDLDEAATIKKLLHTTDMNYREIAERVGRSPSFISQLAKSPSMAKPEVKTIDPTESKALLDIVINSTLTKEQKLTILGAIL